jgi:hypothetical protein
VLGGGALPPFNGTEICINAGGTQIEFSGDTFLVDQLYSPGVPATATFVNNNAGLVIDELYRSERNAVPPGTGNGTMTYDIPVINGTYDIELHFAEIYYGVPGGTNNNPPHTNKRMFHVAIEGTQVLTDYDIVAEAGGSGIPIVETFTVNVTDGSATILFTNIPGKNRAKVSGICVKPHQELGGGPGLCSGSYEVTVTDANGCQAASAMTMTVVLSMSAMAVPVCILLLHVKMKMHVQLTSASMASARIHRYPAMTVKLVLKTLALTVRANSPRFPVAAEFLARTASRVLTVTFARMTSV